MAIPGPHEQYRFHLTRWQFKQEPVCDRIISSVDVCGGSMTTSPIATQHDITNPSRLFILAPCRKDDPLIAALLDLEPPPMRFLFGGSR
jgi:hypothetical protein